MLNLANILVENALYEKRDKVAMRIADKSYTFAELDAMSNKVANFLLEKGISQSDKVALSCPNLPYFPIVYYGILKAGAVVVPLNVLLKQQEIAYLLRDSEAKALFIFEGTAQLPLAQEGFAAFDEVSGCQEFVVLTTDPTAASPIANTLTLGQILATASSQRQLATTDESDTAVILYTSGTTGKPKGAELTHFNVFMNAMLSSEPFRKRPAAKQHVFLLVLPLFHSFGQVVGMNGSFFSGEQVVLLPRFDARQAIDAMLHYGVTIFAGVPTMYWGILHELKNYSPAQVATIGRNLLLCFSGGAAMPAELMRNFDEALGVEILEGYGLSETSPVASTRALERPRKVGSIGQPIWGVEMKVVDADDNEVPVGEVGEIVIRGHNIMKGYYNRPEETAQAMRNGWFHSGDMGKMDEDGYFYIVDRVKDMVIRGGYNVYPREIEEVLMTHPDISLAAVIGVAHEQYGEEVKAYVVLKEGATSTEEGLVAWSKENMAAYKYPRLIEIRDSLPLGPTGKVLKRELRKIISSE